MKKIILSLFLILSSHSTLGSEDNSFFSKIATNGLKYLMLKFLVATEYISHTQPFQKLHNYIANHALCSDQLIIIIPQSNNNEYGVKFINLYNLNLLKDKFILPNQTDIISSKIYYKLKAISSPLECNFQSEYYNIILPNGKSLIFNSTVNHVEAVILKFKDINEISKF